MVIRTTATALRYRLCVMLLASVATMTACAGDGPGAAGIAVPQFGLVGNSAVHLSQVPVFQDGRWAVYPVSMEIDVEDGRISGILATYDVALMEVERAVDDLIATSKTRSFDDVGQGGQMVLWRHQHEYAVQLTSTENATTLIVLPILPSEDDDSFASEQQAGRMGRKAQDE